MLYSRTCRDHEPNSSAGGGSLRSNGSSPALGPVRSSSVVDGSDAATCAATWPAAAGAIACTLAGKVADVEPAEVTRALRRPRRVHAVVKLRQLGVAVAMVVPADATTTAAAAAEVGPRLDAAERDGGAVPHPRLLPRVPDLRRVPAPRPLPHPAVVRLRSPTSHYSTASSRSHVQLHSPPRARACACAVP
uniref:Uncharacterized protein n=1 Tax=Oryza nivara TaxID=4536 RepID=A0A0E0HGD2_ORYNI